MAQVIITNTSSHALSIDFSIDGEEIRDNLDPGETLDIGDRVAIDDVNQNDIVKSLIANGRITVASIAEAGDISTDLGDDAVETNDITDLAVTEAKIAALAVTEAKIAALAVTPSKMNLIVSAMLGAPDLLDIDLVYTATDWADGTLAIAAQPDVPRNLTAALTDVNNSVSGLLTIAGLDMNGNVVEETMAPDAAGGGKTLLGTKIFASITSIVISGTGGTVDVGVDQLVIGIGNVIGLPTDIIAAGAVKSVYVNGVITSADAVSVGVSTSGIDINSATYDGSKQIVAAYNVGE